MTDAHPAFDYAAAYARIEAEQAARGRLAAEALAAASITSVVITFDGESDSGQIENVDVRAGEDRAELPAVVIEIATPAYDGAALERRRPSLTEAIEDIVYGFLSDTHPGWENNDGAYGEFTFDVAERRISLDHNSRYTEVHTSRHEW